MSEYKERNGLTTQELLKPCDPQVLPNGDILYISSEYYDDFYPHYFDKPEPFQLILSGEYYKTDEPDIRLLQLLNLADRRPHQSMYHGVRGFVTKENLGNWLRRQDVAVKRLFPHMLDMTGIEQFKAVRELEEEGVFCASPIVATRWRYVSKWIKGQPGYKAERYLPEYLESLDRIAEKLKDKHRWNKDWKIERQPANYVVRDLKDDDPLQRFVSVDPVFIHSAFVSG